MRLNQRCVTDQGDTWKESGGLEVSTRYTITLKESLHTGVVAINEKETATADHTNDDMRGKGQYTCVGDIEVKEERGNLRTGVKEYHHIHCFPGGNVVLWLYMG